MADNRQKIRQVAEEIVLREGGFVDDPDDPGGATKYGVTIHTLRRLGLDLDGDGVITAEDVRAIGREQAVEIFIEHYFTRPDIAALPDILQESVFDMYVNAGGQAVKLLQKLLCEMDEPVTPDGVIGPMTVSASKRAAVKAPHHLKDAYGIARRNYYLALADRRPASRKFARTRSGSKGGWIRRAEEFISPRYHLTEAEFQARTRAWG